MTTECSRGWDGWVKEALARLESLKIVRSLRPISLSVQQQELGGDASRGSESGSGGNDDEYEVFEEMKPWDRASVEVDVADSTFRSWLHDIPSSGKHPLFFFDDSPTSHNRILDLAHFWMCYRKWSSHFHQCRTFHCDILDVYDACMVLCW